MLVLRASLTVIILLLSGTIAEGDSSSGGCAFSPCQPSVPINPNAVLQSDQFGHLNFGNPNLSADLPISVRAWGAKCDNAVTDDSAAINAALASTAQVISLPASPCRAGSTIVVPDNKILQGIAFQPYAPVPANASAIICDLAVTPCLNAGNATNRPNQLSKFTIGRAAGAIPATAVCVNFNQGQNITVEDVMCYRHAQGFQLINSGALGIYFRGQRLYTCGITDADVVVSGWPGAYFNSSTFGCNGAFDVAHQTFVRLTGNWDATVGTVHFTDAHLNLGQNTVTCAFSFQGFTGTTNVIQDIEFIGGHIETDQNAFCSDATVKGLTNFQLVGLWTGGGWGGANHFFANSSNSYSAGLNPATTINTMQITGGSMTGFADLTLAPSAQMNDVKVTGFAALIPITLTGVGSSTANLTGNSYNGVTINGSWGNAIIDGTSLGGAITDNSTAGSVQLQVPGANQNSMRNCSAGFGLQLGGIMTGITYSPAPVCQYQLVGNQVVVSYFVKLSSKGTATGAASFIGLPFTSSGSDGLGGSAVFNSNMAGLTGLAVAFAGAASRSINLYQQSTTGLTTITDANLTNTSVMSGTLTYLVGNSP